MLELRTSVRLEEAEATLPVISGILKALHPEARLHSQQVMGLILVSVLFDGKEDPDAFLSALSEKGMTSNNWERYGTGSSDPSGERT